MCERDGHTGSLNRIQTLMRAMKLRTNAGRKCKATTDSGRSMPVAAHLPSQDFSCDTGAEPSPHAEAPDPVWLSEMTCLWTREEINLPLPS
jgi:hypothetical protein